MNSFVFANIALDPTQVLTWLAVVSFCCLAVFVTLMIVLRQGHGGALEESKSGYIIVAPPHAPVPAATPTTDRPPFVQIGTEGATRTQSQTWPPPRATGGVSRAISENVRAGVIANLTRWLKQNVILRLVSDRSQLLATQEAATIKAQEVDERLAKIEHQIRERNQDYERRIDVLLKALLTAEEHNRELIRAQIAMVRGEMERARLKDNETRQF